MEGRVSPVFCLHLDQEHLGASIAGYELVDYLPIWKTLSYEGSFSFQAKAHSAGF